MDYTGVKSHISGKLKNELSKNLYYHRFHHTLDVLQAGIKLAKLEGLPKKETEILKTAILFHDAGFTKVYQNHEKISIDIAKKTLPEFGYDDATVAAIAARIRATKIPQSPQNVSEKIICDADLDYLGRTDYYIIADDLRKELMGMKFIADNKEWLKIQIDFLETHHYWTTSAVNLRARPKTTRLKELKDQFKILYYHT